MKKKIVEKNSDEVNINIINAFLNMSFEDYIAARILICKGKLLQGCILANTSIEKFFKAMMEVHGTKSFGRHDLSKQLPFIKNQFPLIYDILNIDFLKQLTNIYKARYVDDLPEDFSCALFQTKYLAELDYTYSILEPLISFGGINTEKKITKYKLAIEHKDLDIWNYNYLLRGIDKSTFIEAPCKIQEFRKLPDGRVLECNYYSAEVKNDGKFCYDAFIPSEDFTTYTFTHKPITKNNLAE